MELQRGLCDLLGDGEQTIDGRPQWNGRRWTMQTVGKAFRLSGGADRQRMGQRINEYDGRR
jgi:hypothetical protein